MGRTALAVFIVLSSCSNVNRVVRAPPSVLELSTLFVFPIAVSGAQFGPHRQFDLAQRAMESVLREAPALALFGPSEFQVIRPEVDDAWVGTDAVRVLVKSGSRPDQGAVLRLFVERRVASSSVQTESLTGRQRGQISNEETTWLVRGELTHPSTKTVLLEVSGTVVVDPFAKPPGEAEWDPDWALTALVDQITVEAARAAQSHAIRRKELPETTLSVAATPASSSITQDQVADPSDELTRELTLFNRAHVLAPKASEAQVHQMARAPGGLWVLIGDSKLNADDVIISIDGAPATSSALARLRLLRLSAELAVQRGRARLSVVWPPQR
jgi:hypothetical protein